ncbi:MAG: 2-amino-4-hydroxy-6-hydroxymethyldihydropteridine diphosphokinase [Verrucomicrobia bacterium CG_4_10_14_3_um_filter_43_23]|nr:MAG: 2-amino-4-hydroxy-6-hydroxymethyldihydropteridine diphosphokinase [Verrucomicrobia bacterium CG1_02_43_26]PIP59652.1 MAG: 2-amino-4-hydroxy-6-hydroxymethyldihydropteridine diphosphokinase [Verrucomicrobia bacterium CG22_combo_CG10-13_8_21_14_all_43_17]PIX58951.1 MAG: 2-amino-4-hydroxy-6-hydroxymethyldihydropteridine diphosphokinase [Verrucomicrobia bacterium CG_4_10_14_3_um_filter_43_23]PIY63096.1 MAG: 2-amino-4-hydroxy-6-hydroxymethyldihydropteridine diphosphokinase [Verrucomicrobia bac
MMTEAYIALGSNLGDRNDYLNKAIGLLAETDGITLRATSSYHETEPVGYLDQGMFLNAVVLLDTTLSPHELLARCQQIEQRLGRERPFQNAPRTIDLDILLYGTLEMNGAELIIPHPRMMERSFVLLPLNEIMVTHSLYLV